MRIAIIDMGTNTFHLMLAHRVQNQYMVTHRSREAVKLGMDGINQATITAEAAGRAIRCLIGFQKTISQFGARQTLAFGTSAFRNAGNATEVMAEITRATGIVPRIISGNQEAEYIYRGVRRALNLGVEKSLIIDIGGGSVEFIIGNQSAIFWKRSMEIGAQRLLERFHRHDPIRASEIAELNRFFKETLPPVFAALAEHAPATLVGSSGTFDTLSEIYCLRQGLPTEPNAPETPLTLAAFAQIHEELVRKNRADRLRIPGMIDMRVDMIVVASCLIRFIVDHHPFRAVRVSGYALKEGVLAALESGGLFPLGNELSGE